MSFFFLMILICAAFLRFKISLNVCSVQIYLKYLSLDYQGFASCFWLNSSQWTHRSSLKVLMLRSREVSSGWVITFFIDFAKLTIKNIGYILVVIFKPVISSSSTFLVWNFIRKNWLNSFPKLDVICYWINIYLIGENFVGENFRR